MDEGLDVTGLCPWTILAYLINNSPYWGPNQHNKPAEYSDHSAEKVKAYWLKRERWRKPGSHFWEEGGYQSQFDTPVLSFDYLLGKPTKVRFHPHEDRMLLLRWEAYNRLHGDQAVQNILKTMRHKEQP